MKTAEQVLRGDRFTSFGGDYFAMSAIFLTASR